LGERTVQKEWTVDELSKIVAKKMKDRDFDRGREVFGSVGCFACHRFANEGGAIGPDLTGIAGRFNARDLLESIIDPGKEVSDQYASIVIEKNDGSEVTGRIVNLSDNNVMVNPNMYDPNEIVRVNRRDIKAIQPSKVSMMPSGLLNVLKEDEILDLMAFLLSRGERDNKMFSKR
jgi:putative heme-binding domain-containing protein